MACSISSGPGVTALGLAAARSVETGRPDRLIEDPLARVLFEAADTRLEMLVEWPAPGRPVTSTEALHLHGSRYIGLRTRFYDDVLMDAARSGATQAVLLGAGLDTRAFRLGLPGSLCLFEVDQPAVLEYKSSVLAGAEATARCVRLTVAADLRDDWPTPLVAAGFNPERPTAWVAEGLLPYLAPDAQVQLLDRIHGLSAFGSTLAFDRIAGDPTAQGRLRGLSARSGIDMEDLLAGGDAGDLRALLEGRGWNAREQPTTALARRYSRNLADPFPTADSGRTSEPPWLDTIFLDARLPTE